MAWTCSLSASPTGCGHRVLTIVRDDGTTRQVHLHDTDVSSISAEEELLLARLAMARLQTLGLPPSQLTGRVVIGEEATNVKLYTFFGPGAAITKTNIGTAYVNIPVGLNGERVVVDLTGCTQFRFMLTANLIGTGQWGARCVRDGDNAVLIEQANLGAAGERELDSDWQNLPAAFLGQGLTFLRVQGKSTTAADDPVFRRCQVGFR